MGLMVWKYLVEILSIKSNAFWKDIKLPIGTKTFSPWENFRRPLVPNPEKYHWQFNIFLETRWTFKSKTYQDWQIEMNSQLIRVSWEMFHDNNWTFSRLRNHSALVCDKLLGTQQVLIHQNSPLELLGLLNSQNHRPKWPNRIPYGHYSQIILFCEIYHRYYFVQRTIDLFRARQKGKCRDTRIGRSGDPTICRIDWKWFVDPWYMCVIIVARPWKL